MHLLSFFSGLSLISVAVFAQNGSFVEPSGKFGGTAGGDCTVEWKDVTWTNAQLDIVSGCDAMHRFLIAVSTNFDASSSTSLTHDCPNVDTSSTIYMYRMSEINSTDTSMYTDRFCIKANSSASCETPEHSTQPSGSGEAWGTGYIENSRLSLYHQQGNTAWN